MGTPFFTCCSPGARRATGVSPRSEGAETRADVPGGRVRWVVGRDSQSTNHRKGGFRWRRRPKALRKRRPRRGSHRQVRLKGGARARPLFCTVSLSSPRCTVQFPSLRRPDLTGPIPHVQLPGPPRRLPGPGVSKEEPVLGPANWEAGVGVGREAGVYRDSATPSRIRTRRTRSPWRRLSTTSMPSTTWPNTV